MQENKPQDCTRGSEQPPPCSRSSHPSIGEQRLPSVVFCSVLLFRQSPITLNYVVHSHTLSQVHMVVIDACWLSGEILAHERPPGVRLPEAGNTAEDYRGCWCGSLTTSCQKLGDGTGHPPGRPILPGHSVVLRSYPDGLMPSRCDAGIHQCQGSRPWPTFLFC